MPSRRAVFIDKDGTLVEDVPYNVDPALLRFTPRALDGLRVMAERGFELIVVTNQPGISMGLFDRAALDRLQRALTQKLSLEGITLAGFYACPHAARPPMLTRCRCRKPAPGMLFRAARAHGLDLPRCFMVGDILDDVEAGQRAGCRTVMLDVGNETVWRASPFRTPHHRAADLLAAAHWIAAQPDPSRAAEA